MTDTAPECVTITPKEAALLLGVHVNTLLEWLNAGRIPARRVGRRWLISRTAFIRWLESAPTKKF